MSRDYKSGERNSGRRGGGNSLLVGILIGLVLGLGIALTGKVVGRLVPVIKTCSPKDIGIDELVNAIDAHREYLIESGEHDKRRQAIRERRMLKAAEVILHDEFARHREGRMAPLLADLGTGHVSPQTAARRLLAHIGMEVL